MARLRASLVVSHTCFKVAGVSLEIRGELRAQIVRRRVNLNMPIHETRPCDHFAQRVCSCPTPVDSSPSTLHRLSCRR